MNELTIVGGNLEQKPIGLKFGVSGTMNNTELVNGKVQLKKVGVDWNNSPIYAESGTWTSDIIDIGDNFIDFGKVFTSSANQSSSNITVETRTSSNGTTFDSWVFADTDGTILSTKNKFIQVRVTFYSDFTNKEMTISNFNNASEKDKFNSAFIDTANGLRLKREYNFDMTLDNSWANEGSLHRKRVTRDEWLRIDKLDGNLDASENKTLILHQNEYKKITQPITENYKRVSKNDFLSDTHSNGDKVSASTTLNNRESWKAFDGKYDTTSAWLTSLNALSGWLSYTFNTPTVVDGYSIRGSVEAEYIDRLPKDWIFEGSNNGTTWIPLDTRNSQIFVAGEIKTFAFENTTPYKTYRLNATSNNGSTLYVMIVEMELFKREYITDEDVYKIKTISSTLPTQEQFLTEGMDSLSPLLDRRVETLEPLLMIDKSEILSDSEEGKMFSKTLGLSKYLDIRSMKVEER